MTALAMHAFHHLYMKNIALPCTRGDRMRRGGLALVVALVGAPVVPAVMRNGGDDPVPYPEGFRTWVHVKTALVSSRHPDFAQTGGFRHIYANSQAVTGYQTGAFPEGSIIVVDWLVGQDENGMFTESARQRVDVMVKDRVKFEATAGWGWERFKGNSRTERTVTAAATQCVACHSGPGARGLVFSKLRE